MVLGRRSLVAILLPPRANRLRRDANYYTTLTVTVNNGPQSTLLHHIRPVTSCTAPCTHHTPAPFAAPHSPYTTPRTSFCTTLAFNHVHPAWHSPCTVLLTHSSVPHSLHHTHPAPHYTTLACNTCSLHCTCLQHICPVPHCTTLACTTSSLHHTEPHWYAPPLQHSEAAPHLLAPHPLYDTCLHPTRHHTLQHMPYTTPWTSSCTTLALRHTRLRHFCPAPYLPAPHPACTTQNRTRMHHIQPAPHLPCTTLACKGGVSRY